MLDTFARLTALRPHRVWQFLAWLKGEQDHPPDYF
jgi:hypothetical protein